jgi:hypothetical protein
MDNRWIVQMPDDMLTAVICSVVGPIIVTVLVDNHEVYANFVPKWSRWPMIKRVMFRPDEVWTRHRALSVMNLSLPSRRQRDS